MDKAKEYAKAAREKIEHGSDAQSEIENAFLAGYRLGLTDAHRKESVSDVQENFARELR